MCIFLGFLTKCSIADNYKAQVSQYVQSLVPPDQRGKEDVKLTLTPEELEPLHQIARSPKAEVREARRGRNPGAVSRRRGRGSNCPGRWHDPQERGQVD